MKTNVKKLPTTDCDTTKRFRDSEQLWFWFLKCRKHDLIGIRINIGRSINKNPYPCEAIDIETLITRLYLSGKLNHEQLKVLKEFGDMRRAPNQHVWSENAKAALWSDAMRTITNAAKEKGWLE